MKRAKKLTVLALCVILLVIVSARLGPDPEIKDRTPDKSTETDEGKAPDVSEINGDNEGSQSGPSDEQPSGNGGEETPPEDPLADLPDISVYDWNLKLVNNTNVLQSGFAPEVTKVQNDQYFDSRAAEKLTEMLQGAANAGFGTYISAAYRPYSTQAYIFYGKASQIAWGGTVEYAEAEIQARELVAYPGTSDHQTGLGVDIMPNSEMKMVAEEVEDNALLVWLKEHCAEYGFILRFPKDKKDITGWYEPWHFRYVGEEAAAYIMEKGLCLEEFLDLY
ncbi:MAG: M15 family metallopeptidase [Oscillospiraceae bacterium]|nr:M15 family metallopeptidase [Oscillospiraceae bacterium]